MADEEPHLTIAMLSKDMMRMADEIASEEWPDKDAQTWYIKGVKDAAHLLILKWTSGEEQPRTP